MYLHVLVHTLFRVHLSKNPQFNAANSINTFLVGSASPSSVDAGTLRFSQFTGNLDAFRGLYSGAVNALTLAVGSDFRVEIYVIEADQFES